MNRTGRRRYVLPTLLVAAGTLVFTVGATSVHRPVHRSLPAMFGRVGSVASAPARPFPSHASTGLVGERRGPQVPTRLRVPGLAVDARVVPTGSVGGAIAVPTRVSSVGWWVGGASPGSTVGTTVLVGHVDSAVSGPGALFHLDRLEPGQLVEVTAGSGPPWRYRVTALRSVPKTTGLARFALEAASAPRLAIITCGGPFDERTRSYADNIVVFASPVEPS